MNRWPEIYHLSFKLQERDACWIRWINRKCFMWKSVNTSRQLMYITTCLCRFWHPVCYKLSSNSRTHDYQISYFYCFYFMKMKMVFEKAERDDATMMMMMMMIRTLVNYIIYSKYFDNWVINWVTDTTSLSFIVHWRWPDSDKIWHLMLVSHDVIKNSS